MTVEEMKWLSTELSHLLSDLNECFDVTSVRLVKEMFSCMTCLNFKFVYIYTEGVEQHGTIIVLTSAVSNDSMFGLNVRM